MQVLSNNSGSEQTPNSLASQEKAKPIEFAREFDRFPLFVDPYKEVAVVLYGIRRTDSPAAYFDVQVLYQFRKGPGDELFTVQPVPAYEMAGTVASKWRRFEDLERTILDALATQEFSTTRRDAKFECSGLSDAPRYVYKGESPHAANCEAFVATLTPWKAEGVVSWANRNRDPEIGRLIEERIPEAIRVQIENFAANASNFNPTDVKVA